MFYITPQPKPLKNKTGDFCPLSQISFLPTPNPCENSSTTIQKPKLLASPRYISESDQV